MDSGEEARADERRGAGAEVALEHTIDIAAKNRLLRDLLFKPLFLLPPNFDLFGAASAYFDQKRKILCDSAPPRLCVNLFKLKYFSYD